MPDDPDDLARTFAPPAESAPESPYAWPPAGYPAWPPPPPGPRGWSEYAIASLVTGLLGAACCLWAVGLGFGIAALRTIPKRNQRGKGMAVAGIVLSCLWAVAFLAGSGYGMPNLSKHTPAVRTDGPSDTITVADMRPGDCVDLTDYSDATTRFLRKPCGQRHFAEVFAEIVLPGTYTDDTVLEMAAERECAPKKADYAMDTWAVPLAMKVYVFHRNAAAWATSDHRAVCAFADRDRSTGSLRRDAHSLNAEQYAYLKAANSLDIQLDRLDPYPLPGADLTGWADQASVVINAELNTLSSTGWNERAKQPVADLEAALRQLLPHVDALRSRLDDPALTDEVHAVHVHLVQPQAAAVRAALGLASAYGRPVGAQPAG